MKRGPKILVVVALVFAGWVAVTPSLAAFLIVQRPLAKAEAIIVLSGSAAYKERTRKAAELYTQGVAPRIFLSDDGELSGWSRDERVNLPFVELARRELVSGSVPPDAITILPGQVSGTDQEAKALAAEIERSPLGSVVLVTSAYHSRRSLRTFDKILKGRRVEIGIEFAPLGFASPDPKYWWLSIRGWRSVGGEYVKSAVYWAYY